MSKPDSQCEPEKTPNADQGKDKDNNNSSQTGNLENVNNIVINDSQQNAPDHTYSGRRSSVLDLSLSGSTTVNAEVGKSQPVEKELVSVELIKLTLSDSIPDAGDKQNKESNKSMSKERHSKKDKASRIHKRRHSEPKALVESSFTTFNSQQKSIESMLKQLEEKQSEIMALQADLVKSFYPARVTDEGITIVKKADASTTFDLSEIKQSWPSLESIKKICTHSEKMVIIGIKNFAICAACLCLRMSHILLAVRRHSEIFLPIKDLQQDMDTCLIQAEAIRVQLNDKLEELNWDPEELPIKETLVEMQPDMLNTTISDMHETFSLCVPEPEDDDLAAKKMAERTKSNIASEAKGTRRKKDAEEAPVESIEDDDIMIDAEALQEAEEERIESDGESGRESRNSDYSNCSAMSKASITPEVRKHMDSPKRQKKITSYAKPGVKNVKQSKPQAARNIMEGKRSVEKPTPISASSKQLVEKPSTSKKAAEREAPSSPNSDNASAPKTPEYESSEDGSPIVKTTKKRKIGEIVDDDEEEEEKYPKIAKIKDTEDIVRRIMWYGEIDMKDIKSQGVKDYLSGLMRSSVFQYGNSTDPQKKKCKKKCCVLCPYTVPEYDRNDARHYKNNHKYDEVPKVKYVKILLNMKQFAARIKAWYPIMMRNQKHR